MVDVWTGEFQLEDDSCGTQATRVGQLAPDQLLDHMLNSGHILY